MTLVGFRRQRAIIALATVSGAAVLITVAYTCCTECSRITRSTPSAPQDCRRQFAGDRHRIPARRLTAGRHRRPERRAGRSRRPAATIEVRPSLRAAPACVIFDPAWVRRWRGGRGPPRLHTLLLGHLLLGNPSRRQSPAPESPVRLLAPLRDPADVTNPGPRPGEHVKPCLPCTDHRGRHDPSRRPNITTAIAPSRAGATHDEVAPRRSPAQPAARPHRT